MIRESIHEPWREVSWDEALGFAAARMTAIQEKHGRHAVGVITSSRCTNEETYLVQKLTRAVFRNNNNRHLRAGLPLAHTAMAWARPRHLGRNAGLRLGRTHGCGHRHRREPDRRPPVFASRLKKRLRKGAS